VKIPEDLGISEFSLQVFVNQVMLWEDNRDLRKYVRFLIASDLAPPPSGRKENWTWPEALKAAEDSFPIDLLKFLQLEAVTEGGSAEVIERDDIPEEHWKTLYVALRGVYRSYIGDEPYALRKIPITLAIGLLEQGLRCEKPISVPHPYGNIREPMSRSQLLAKGLITPEESKPEWLRGLNGSYVRVARWFPVDRDGNPIE
jgi:hypothetical protein